MVTKRGTQGRLGADLNVFSSWFYSRRQLFMLKFFQLPCLLFSGTLLAASGWSVSDFALLSQQAKAELAGRPAFRGSAVLMQGKTMLWQYQQGAASQGEPFTAHTAFFVGSVSKTLTAILVMQQVQAGVLDLQAPVKRYLPELKQPWAASVRLADLLSHGSGLVDISTQQDYSQFRYHNLNFQLLGQILTAVTQRPYAELADQVLQQCQMTQAGFADKAADATGGWHEEQGQLKAISGFMPVEAEPSGGLIASAAEVALLPWCMQQQLSKTSVQQMTTAKLRRQHRWGRVYYGYGVQVAETTAGPEWSHGGYIPGYVSVFNHFPEQQLTLVVLENQSLDPADFARAAYYHDSLRETLIKILSQNPKG